MHDLDLQIQEARDVLDRSLRDNDTEAVERAANALNALITAQKTAIEAASLRQSGREELRYWVPIAGGFLSAMGIIAGLFFQGVQEHDRQIQARQDAIDARYQSAVQASEQASGPGRKVGMALLGSFLMGSADEPHASDARAVAIVLLSDPQQDESTFNLLYPQLVRTTTAETFHDLVTLNQTLWTVAVNAGNARDRASAQANGGPYYQQEFREREEQAHALDDELYETQPGLIKGIKTYHDASLDLSNIFLRSTDLDNVDFGNAELTQSTLRDSSVHGADFSKLRGFDKSDWRCVKWWEAKVSPELATFAEKQTPKETYSQEKCDRDIYSA